MNIEELFQNDYWRFLIILIVTIILIVVTYFILKILINRFVGGKKRKGNFILKQITKPVLLLILVVCLFTAIKPLTILSEYILLVDGVFFVLAALLSALLVSRIITVLMLGYLRVRKGFERPPRLLNKAISIIIFVIAVAVILAYFKIDITPLIAGVGLGALAIGLALQSTLSNFFAGVHLLSDRPINIGDFIELDKDTTGIVEDIGWRSTRIRTLTDNMLVIPNAKLADSNITNFSMPKNDMSIWVPCGVAYESDLRKVEEVTLEVAKEIQKNVPGAVSDFQPIFRYREFADSNINFTVVLRVSEPMSRFVVRNEFIKLLKERFDREKIEISWPIRKIYNVK